MTRTPLVIWRFRDGKPGHEQQTLGLAQAICRQVDAQVVDVDVKAIHTGLLGFLLNRFPQGHHFPKPDLLIGAGHATHWAMLTAKRAFGGRTIVLMKPSLPRFLFDAVIVPEHDGLGESERVINTRGVLNPMRPSEKKADSVLFLIGGPSKHVRWDNTTIQQQLEVLVTGLKAGASWCVTDSRRTPESLGAILLQKYGERFQPHGQCPPGWLAEQLAVTDVVWVSEDSVSMVYEALTAGCRVGLLQLPQEAHANRVMRGMERLLAENKVTGFSDWSGSQEMRTTYQLNEAERVAELLLERLFSAG